MPSAFREVQAVTRTAIFFCGMVWQWWWLSQLPFVVSGLPAVVLAVATPASTAAAGVVSLSISAVVAVIALASANKCFSWFTSVDFFSNSLLIHDKNHSTNSKCGGNRNYESNFFITIIAYVELHLAYSESVRFHKYAHENMQQYRRKRQKATIRTQWCKTTHLHIYMSCHANNTRDETLFTTFIHSNLQLRWCLPCIYVHF